MLMLTKITYGDKHSLQYLYFMQLDASKLM